MKLINALQISIEPKAEKRVIGVFTSSSTRKIFALLGAHKGQPLNTKIQRTEDYKKIKIILDSSLAQQLFSEISSVKFLIQNNLYKGVRRRLRLPVRGQRTHTNAKTARKLNG